MDCVKCGKPAAIDILALHACKSCFPKIIEKRVRKEIRLNKLIEKDDRVIILDDGSAPGVIAADMLQRIIKKLPVTIEIRKSGYSLGEKIAGSFDKVIVPWSTDREDEYFLTCLFDAKKPKYLGHYNVGKKRYVKMFLHVLEEEAEDLARLHGKRFRPYRHDSIVSELFSKVDTLYPEVKFSVLRSSEELGK